MKRTRSHQVSFRLNDKEYALLQRKLAASGLSLTEFFIETISKGKVIVISNYISCFVGSSEILWNHLLIEKEGI